MDEPTGPGHRRPSAKFSMRCGCSMPNSKRRFRSLDRDQGGVKDLKGRRPSATASGAAPCSRRSPHWCCCRSRPATPAGCRICSRVRQKPTNHPSQPLHQNAPPKPGLPPCETCHLGEGCYLAEARQGKARRAGTGGVASVRPETGRAELRSRKVQDRRGCRTYRRIRRRQSAPAMSPNFCTITDWRGGSNSG